MSVRHELVAGGAMVSGRDDGSDLSLGILDATSSLLIVTEVGTGLVVAMNRAAEKMTGFNRDQVIGHPLWEIAAPEHTQMLRRALEGAVGGGLPESFESTVNLRSGKPRRIVWSSTSMKDASGIRTHVVMTGIDMSSEAASGGLFAHLMHAANTTAMISTDRRGRVTYCSSGAAQMLGIEGSQLVGRRLPLEMFDPSEVRARAAELQLPVDLGVLMPTAPGTESEVSDWTVTRKDGSRLIVSIAISSAHDSRGVHVGYVGVAHDVTDHRRANQTLEDALLKEEKAVERLHELNRAKSEFVATVSHELRTPTTNIVGCTELLLDGLAGELNESQRRLVGTVDRNSVRLVSLADDLVLLARADAGDLEMEFAALDLRSVVRGTRETLQTLLLDRELETIVELPETPVQVNGDGEHLARALRNLVGNAVKFTDDGGLVACRLSVDHGDAVLEISDSGVGIPAQEQGDLFTRFFRSSTSEERASQGSGLGLSIVASIVHQHGGTISVVSEHLDGCTFTVRLPLLVPEGASHSAA